jgi:hypothetical protein
LATQPAPLQVVLVVLVQVIDAVGGDLQERTVAARQEFLLHDAEDLERFAHLSEP